MPVPRTELGVIGSGSMGRGMALLYTEKGNTVHLYDVNKDAVQSVLREAQETKSVPDNRIKLHDSLSDFMQSFPHGKERLIVTSLPHGKVIDSVIDGIEPHLKEGDIIVDGANEHYKVTERRQARLQAKGVAWIGCGVSGGYQASRRGPSMSPGGDKKAYDKIEPLLKEWAAKAKDGTPCVEYQGPAGAGHYVKMAHNGIEQGQLSVLSEAYEILHKMLAIPNVEIQDIFKSWNAKGELSGDFLVDLGALVVSFREGDGIKNEGGIVDNIEDKVVQDADSSEGTGVWMVEESAARHVATPTIATAHYLRLISANKRERLQVIKKLNLPQPQAAPPEEKAKWIELLRLAVYGGFLCSFVQGLNLIAKASAEFGWNIRLDKCLQIWREGCIIKSGYIADLIQPIYEADPKLLNLLTADDICNELQKTVMPLKELVKLAIDANAVVPAISASLEYIKAAGSEGPTNFEEAELDAFGDHMFSRKDEGKLDPAKGEHHIEWRQA